MTECRDCELYRKEAEPLPDPRAGDRHYCDHWEVATEAFYAAFCLDEDCPYFYPHNKQRRKR